MKRLVTSCWFAACCLGLLAMVGCNSVLGIGDVISEDDASTSPPARPSLRSPRMGATTGSVHAEASLRPRFEWRASSAATRYEVAIDDSCVTASFKTCLFPSPEVLVTVADTTYTPTAAFAVSRAAPVGRRYFWRVRACTAHACSDWSETWYLDVGRLADDVNGDGYGDLVVGIVAAAERPTEVGAAYLAFGRPDAGTVMMTKLSEPREQADTRFGTAVAMVGDVNADGYGDVIVGAWKAPHSTYTGEATLYLGRGTWPSVITSWDQESVIRFLRGLNDADTAFGGSVAGGGDVNGDGYGDIAIASVPAPSGLRLETPTAPGYVHVHFGRPSWSFSQAGSDLVIPDPDGLTMGMFGDGLAVGDLNEDGLADLVVGGWGASPFRGVAAVYVGQSSFPAAPHTITTSSVHLPSPAETSALFGFTAAICRSERAPPALSIGAPLESRPAAWAGTVRTYAGREPWPQTVTSPTLTLVEPTGAVEGGMGNALGCGDVNANGADDLAVGAPTGDDSGAIYVYGDVTTSASDVPFVTLTSGISTGTLGTSLALTDFNGDGVTDVFGGAPALNDRRGRVLGWFGRSVWPSSIVGPDITIDNPSGVMEERFGWTLD